MYCEGNDKLMMTYIALVHVLYVVVFVVLFVCCWFFFFILIQPSLMNRNELSESSVFALRSIYVPFFNVPRAPTTILRNVKNNFTPA